MAPWAIVPDVAARVRMPPRMIPMHGLQPIAKIAPRPNDASQPPRELTTWPPIRSPTLGRRAAAPEGGRARRGRQRSGGAGVERSPGPLEGRDVEQPGQVQPEHDEDDPADRAQGRQVVDEGTGHEGAHDAEEREDGAESGDVREASAGPPASATAGRPQPNRATAIAVSWPT